MTEETRVALLEAKMSEIKTEISEIKTDIKALSKQLDTLFNAKITDHIQIQADLKLLTENQRKYQEQSHFWRWFSPTLSAVAGSILTILILNFINRLK